MAFNNTQLVQVEAAIIVVAAGGVAEIQDAFGNKTRYQSVKELLDLKKIIEDDVAANARTSGFDKYKFAVKA
jgi:hypothetical protein